MLRHLAIALATFSAPLIPYSAFAAPPAPKASATPSKHIDIPPPGSSGLPVPGANPVATAASAGKGRAVADRLLWDAWYTVTVNKVVKYEYYNEHVELKNGKVFFQNHVWKQEEDFLNEEQLGAVAELDPGLTPVFFNYHSTYRSTETTIDGNVKGGKALTVRIRKGNTELPIVRRMLPSKTILSTYFPVWVGMHLAEMKPGHSMPFLTILEDNIDVGFSTVSGNVRLDAPDDLARRTGTQKLLVDYRDLKTVWWVDRNGTAARIEMPEQKTIVERVTEEKAKKFLDE